MALEHLEEEIGELAERALPSNADALVSMAETLLAHGLSQRAGGARYQLVVHVEPQALSDDAPDASCELDNGAAARSAGERLDHDLAIEGLLHTEGWLGLERPAPKVAKDSRGSAEPEPYERPELA